jgi:hypothetical protein
VIRPALYGSVQSAADWIMLQSGIVSQIFPYLCGMPTGDLTQSQSKSKCGRPTLPHTELLFEIPSGTLNILFKFLPKNKFLTKNMSF